MRITVDSGELRAAVAEAAKAIAAKNSLPIMGCVLLRVTGAHGMEVSGGDNDITVTRAVSVFEGGDGAFCVNAKTLADALRNIPARPITVRAEGGAATFDYGGGRFTLPTQDAGDWPEEDRPGADAVTVTVSAADMADAFSRTAGRTADDIVHPVTGGVYMEAADGRLAFSATDGHQLCRCVYGAPYTGGGCGMIIPARAVGLLGASLPADGDVEVSAGGRAAWFAAGGYRLRTSLIAGRFPNVDSVIPRSAAVTAAVGRDTLVSAIRRMMPMANGATGLVRLEFAPSGELRLAAQDIDWSTSAEETVMCQSCTGGVRVGLKGGLLADILSQSLAGCAAVLMEMTDAARAVVMRPADGAEVRGGVTALLMPMLLND